jgi:hypothetical protein
LDNLADFRTIRLTHQGRLYPVVTRHPDDLNDFTLLDALLRAENTTHMVVGSQNQRGLQFPDLTQIVIHRPESNSVGKAERIMVNLLNGTNGIALERDVPLQFGDVVEVPVREYALNERPIGLTPEQRQTIERHLERRLSLHIRGEIREIVVPWSFTVLNALQSPVAQSLLRSSSDLSRVKIRRTARDSGSSREFVVDTTQRLEGRDVFVRDGDVIEVPERSATEAGAAQSPNLIPGGPASPPGTPAVPPPPPRGAE